MTLRDLRNTFAPDTRFFIWTYADEENAVQEVFEITNVLWGTNSFISMEANYVQCKAKNEVYIYTDMPIGVFHAWKQVI